MGVARMIEGRELVSRGTNGYLDGDGGGRYTVVTLCMTALENGDDIFGCH